VNLFSLIFTAGRSPWIFQ